MERTRYFRTANTFNSSVNSWSGNMFPMNEEDKNLSVAWRIWAIFVYTMNATFLITILLGSLYFANLTVEELFKRLGALGVVFFEFIVPSIYLHTHRDEVRRLIGKYNDVLVDSDELRKCVRETVEPYKRGFQLFMSACVFSGTSWAAAPIPIILKYDKFTYANFTAPAYLPGEPFSQPVFALGVLLQIVGDFFISFGKTSVDVYISYFVVLLTAQYKYLQVITNKAFGRVNGREDDSTVVRKLRNCVRHHCAVIDISQRLTRILALYVGSTYVTSILKFCFLAFGLAKFETANVEMAAYFIYSSGCLLHIFLVCSCIQELLDESTSVMKDAFHENWHARGMQVKHIFCMMGMSTRIECRLSAYRIVDLVRPTLAVILSKAYSVCLLLLEVN